MDSRNNNAIVNPTTTRTNVRKTVWDSSAHVTFLELCLDEDRKGNKPGSHLNRAGWANLKSNFKERTGKSYTRLQFKNHWDATKRDWKLYDQLMRMEAGLGWDPVRKTLDATPEWWDEKIQADPKLAKFKDKNLEMYQMFYDPIFRDDVARIKAPQFESDNGLTDVHKENGARDVEGKGDSDEVNCFDPEILFPENSAAIKRKKTENVAYASKGKATLVQPLSTRSTTSFPPPNSVPSIQDCMAIVSNFPGFEPGSKFYNRSLRIFWKKEARESFMIPPTNETKLGFLKSLMEE